jgi:hypothetical protein
LQVGLGGGAGEEGETGGDHQVRGRAGEGRELSFSSSNGQDLRAKIGGSGDGVGESRPGTVQSIDELRVYQTDDKH